MDAIDPDIVLQRALHELEALESPKLWLTARGLAGRIRKHVGLESVSQTDVYDLLAHHAEHARPRLIRNSKAPSARTLEVLWGALSRVSEMDVPPPRKNAESYDQATAELYQRRSAVAGDGSESEVTGSPDFFLSYNFNDTTAAEQVTRVLEQKGHSVWMAGACIAADAIINDEVRDAMTNARGMLLYLSSSSLRSLWVAKEQLVGDVLPRQIVVKGDDPDLTSLVCHWMEGGDDAARMNDFGGLLQVDSASYNVATSFREKLKTHVLNRTLPIFMYPAENTGHERLVPLDQFPVAADQRI